MFISLSEMCLLKLARGVYLLSARSVSQCAFGCELIGISISIQFVCLRAMRTRCVSFVAIVCFEMDFRSIFIGALNNRPT